MLKVKRIAKVMICICVIFSMSIIAFAVDYNITVNNTTFNQVENGNNTVIGVLNNNNYNIIKIYSGSSTPAYIKIETPENIQIAISRQAVPFNNVQIIVSNSIGNSVLYEELSNNNTYRTFVYIINVIPENGIAEFSVSTLFSDGTGSVFNIGFVYILGETESQKAINSINNVFNNIINNTVSIFTFITDKPWIILLGVSVSLISFLIYKAKTII